MSRAPQHASRLTRVKNWNCRCQKLNLISIGLCTRQLTIGLVEQHPAQFPMSFLIAVRAEAVGAPKGRQLGWWLVSQNDRCWRRPPTRKRASISQTRFWFHRPSARRRSRGVPSTRRLLLPVATPQASCRGCNLLRSKPLPHPRKAVGSNQQGPFHLVATRKTGHAG